MASKAIAVGKVELLNWLQEQYQQWNELLAQVGPQRMEQTGVNGVNGPWSMKDMVAHLAGWNRRVVTRLQAAQRGDPEPPLPWPAHLETEDETNAWIYETNRDRPLREVLDSTEQTHQQLVAAIEALPDDVRIERVEPTYYFVWIGDKRFPVGEFYDHFRDDHEADVRTWLASEADDSGN